MGNDKEFAKTQIDKASSFLAGYNSNKDLIIKFTTRKTNENSNKDSPYLAINL